MFSIRFCRVIFTSLATILLALPAISHATTVRLPTSLGAIDITLYDNAAPRTVANFLSYVNSGAYNNSFIHRSVPGFIIQGGGYVWNDASGNVSSVFTYPPVANEFSPSRSNRRGTIAMAKLGGDPNSATSQWFINLADNAASLDGQNGGFTVFGEVTASSMAVVDAIARLPVRNAGGPNGAFGELPIVGNVVNNAIQKSNLAIISTATAITNNYQGLWWAGQSESGWGMSLTQHGDILFVAIYTYDETGLPIWYVITNCPVTPSGCSGDIYRVNGGTPPTVAWTGQGRILTKVGTGTLAFSNTSSGTFTFNINNIAGSKAITQQIFGNSANSPAFDYTDLWWNPNESGWGVSLTQQSNIIFAAWYTYDAAGKPIWYVATNCPATATGCTAPVYQFTGGAPLTSQWRGVNPANEVGQVTFAFSDPANGTMSYTINGVTSSRVITRQVY